MDKMIGKVWVLGDDIDTDNHYPTEYLALKTIDDMKQYGFPRCARNWQRRSSREILLLQERTLAVAPPESRRRRLLRHWEFSA